MGHRDNGKKRQLMVIKNIKRYWPMYVMAFPGIAYLIINNYIPMGGVVLAFKNYNVRQGIWKSPWAGFGNFQYLFKTEDAFIITRNTVLYNLVFIIIGTALSVFISILLKYSLQGTTQSRYLTGGVPPVRFSM